MSSSEPPRSPASDEAGGSGTPSEPPPPPPPVQTAWSEQPPPPPPPDAGADAPDGAGLAEPPRRRGLVLGIVAAVVVIAVPVVLAVVAAVSAPEADAPAETATGDEEDDHATSEPDPVPPDLESLSGRDALLARLLSAVDESERAMIAFQDRLQEVMQDPDADPEDRLEVVQEAAEEGADALDEVRPELARAIDDQGFEEVRLAYLSHHDAWANYLDALAEDPTILLAEAEGSRWLVSINLSAEVFARELRDAVDDDLDTSVQAYARDILARGFEQPDRTPDA